MLAKGLFLKVVFLIKVILPFQHYEPQALKRCHDIQDIKYTNHAKHTKFFFLEELCWDDWGIGKIMEERRKRVRRAASFMARRQRIQLVLLMKGAQTTLTDFLAMESRSQLGEIS